MDENVRPDDMDRITTPELAQAFINEQVAAIREQVGDKKVLLAAVLAAWTPRWSLHCSSAPSGRTSCACT